MFDAIAQKLFSSGIKKVISSGTSSAIAHKVADAVVNGATSTSKKVADVIAKELTSTSASVVKTAIDSVVKKVRGTKRFQSIPAAAAEPSIVDWRFRYCLRLAAVFKTTMMAEAILNFQEKYTESDAIKNYEHNEYQPTSGSNLNISGNITIHIENQDEFFHPRRSYLLVEGNLLKEDGRRVWWQTML